MVEIENHRPLSSLLTNFLTLGLVLVRSFLDIKRHWGSMIRYHGLFQELLLRHIENWLLNFNFFPEKPDTITKEREIQKPTSLPVRKPTSPSKTLTAEAKTTSTSEATKNIETGQKPKLSPLHTPSNTSSDKAKVVRSLSDQCFIGLFWALVLSRLWMHIWIVQLLLPLGFILWLVKFLGKL